MGKQQLIEIAKAMAKKVELLILDEPTAAPVSYTHLDVYKRQSMDLESIKAERAY